jgi:hypothetical protein
MIHSINVFLRALSFFFDALFSDFAYIRKSSSNLPKVTCNSRPSTFESLYNQKGASFSFGGVVLQHNIAQVAIMSGTKAALKAINDAIRQQKFDDAVTKAQELLEKDSKNYQA